MNITKKLEIIIQPIYNSPISFPAGQKYTVVKRNLLFGLIDISGIMKDGTEIRDDRYLEGVWK